MNHRDHSGDDELIERVDRIHARVSAGQRELFRLIAELDRREAWRGSGARDMAHWLSMRHDISCWKANRWISAAHALDGLPHIAEAFAAGELGMDKVVELTRFATPETEASLIRWAQGVSTGGVRHKADVAARRSPDEASEADQCRTLSWWYFRENSRFGLHAELPAEQGAVVVKALDGVAETLPALPGEADPHFADARRADALVALASARIAGDADADRATVVIHARLTELVRGDSGAEIEGGPAIHPETARRLLCTARLQLVVENEAGDPIGLGRISREPPAWMMRQLRYRDRECRFPGCGARRFTQAHHIVFWTREGRTDLGNLILVCSFHHKLVHEYGWRVKRDADGTVQWFRPDGIAFRPGPGPPPEAAQGGPAWSAAGW